MKKLSIEEKAQRYDKAIEKLSSLHNNYDTVSTLIDIKEELEAIFPEIKESEDERMRKEMLQELKDSEDSIILSPFKRERWIAWLEKQGENFQYWKPSEEQLEALDYAYNSCPDTERGDYYEGVLETLIDDLHKLSEKQGLQILDNSAKTCKDEQKSSIEMITPEESLGIDSDTYNKIVDECVYGEQEPVNIDYISGIRKGLLNIEDNAENIVGLTESQWVAIRAAHRILGEYITKEQNHAWSEEDEEMIDAIIADIQFTQKAHNHDVNQVVYEKEIDWLKSLKDRYTWKPSEEQMKSLRWVIEYGNTTQTVTLKGIYQQLKKLREE